MVSRLRESRHPDARTDGGSDVAEVDRTPLGQRQRCLGHHEPDGIRAKFGCHFRDRSGAWTTGAWTSGPGTTAPSAAITSAFRGRPDARVTMAPSGPRTRTVGVLLITARPTRPTAPP